MNRRPDDTAQDQPIQGDGTGTSVIGLEGVNRSGHSRPTLARCRSCQLSVRIAGPADAQLPSLCVALDGDALPRDLDLAVLLLCAGALARSQRTLARALIVSLDIGVLPAAAAWLMRDTASDDVVALAERLRKDTAPPRTFGANPFSETLPTGGGGADAC